MRRPPPLSDIVKYPIVGGTSLLAIVASLGDWSHKLDVTPLYETIAIRQGALWQLVTSVLPHVDPLHLIFNVYWTWVFGTLIESTYGHLKTLAIFILFAVIANGSEYAILIGGVGLSGIGYGLFGLLWMLSRHDRRFDDAIDQRTIGLFVAWFFICIFLTVSGSLPVANIAHGMGAVAGAALGWAISARAGRRILASITVGVLAVAVLLGVTVLRPWINLSKEGGYDEARLAYNALIADHNEAALRWSRDAVRMQPRIASFWMNLGIALDRLKRHPEALAAYKHAVDLEPNNPAYQLSSQNDPDFKARPSSSQDEDPR